MIGSLVSAPKIEAVEIVDKLNLRDERTLRLTLFSLQKLIRVCLLFAPFNV
jgi:engulfment and cell motility protein 1